MPNATPETKRVCPISGSDFARAVLNQKGDKAVEILLEVAHGGETDWLEKKAGVYPSKEKDPGYRAKLEKCRPEDVAKETKFYEAELLRSIACALVALHNSRGGVLFVGIADANEPVPFETCDGDGILAAKGLGAYVLQSVLGRLHPKGGLFSCKKATWTVPVESFVVEPKICSYKGTNVLALLVPPLEQGHPPVLVTRTENNRPRKLLLRRVPGDVGAVRTDERESAWDGSAATLAAFHDVRERAFLSNADLFGKLQILGIEPPPQRPRTKPNPGNRRTPERRPGCSIQISIAFAIFIACGIVLITSVRDEKSYTVPDEKSYTIPDEKECGVCVVGDVVGVMATHFPSSFLNTQEGSVVVMSKTRVETGIMPEIGIAFAIFVSCGIVLIMWVRHKRHTRSLPKSRTRFLP